jgi:Lipocalin-like domain
MIHLSWRRAPEGHGILGSWRLAALEEAGAGGSPRRVDATGSLILTRDGRMSVHVMYRGVQSQSDTGTVQYAQGGYEASFGRYELDELGRSFTYHVEGALVRSLVGKNLKRLYEIQGPQLVIKPAAADEHWRVVWERDEEGR